MTAAAVHHLWPSKAFVCLFVFLDRSLGLDGRSNQQ